MTFSIVARCPRTGEYGVGIATYSPNVGVRCPVVVPQRGAASLQAVANPYLLPIAQKLIASALTAEKIVFELLASDPRPESRQILVVDVYGQSFAHTGEKSPDWAGHITGNGYAVAGNVIASEAVVNAMARAFENSIQENLAERLMRSIEAGRDAGGQIEGQNSSALLVYGDQPFPLVDLRVELHDQPEAELRRIWDWFSPMVPYYLQRAIVPVPKWWQWRMDNVSGWIPRHLR
jgi:uncharacterized Ntn-hydrolase superfamily protein